MREPSYRYPQSVVESLQSFLTDWSPMASTNEQRMWVAEVNAYLQEFDPDGHYGGSQGPWMRFGKVTGRWSLPSEETNDDIWAQRYASGRQALLSILRDQPMPQPWREGLPVRIGNPPLRRPRTLAPTETAAQSIVVFMSYRRNDTRYFAGRIIDRLESDFGAGSVFYDVDSMRYGADWHQQILDAIQRVSVVVVLIGENWMSDRLSEDDDPVRTEIETAFEYNKPVFPLLVRGASMPAAEQLPQTIVALASLHAATVDYEADFHIHMSRFINRLMSSLNGT